MSGARRGRRTVQDQRLHQNHSAARNRASNNRASLTPLRNLVNGKPPASVRATHDAQRPVILGTVIQMQSDGNHALQQWRRRLDVSDSLFNRPRAEARDLPSRLHADRQILMPGHMPIRFRRLIKQDGPHQKTARNHSANQTLEKVRLKKARKLGHAPMQLTGSSTLGKLLALERAQNHVNRFRGSKLFNDHEAVVLELCFEVLVKGSTQGDRDGSVSVRGLSI